MNIAERRYAPEPPVASGRLLLLICLLIPAVMLLISGFLLAAQFAFLHFGHAATPSTWAYFHTNLHDLRDSASLARDDSWKPMLIARQWLAQNPAGAVYDAVFFKDGVKFQYPLTSLFFIDWLRIDGMPAIHLLNAMMLGFAMLTGAGMVMLTLRLADAVMPPARRLLGRDRLWLAAVAAMATLCFYPLMRATSLGQIQVVLDALFVGACLAHLASKRLAAGFLLGLSTLVKPQMALFGVWAILRRDRAFLVGWSIPVVAGLVVSLVVYGSGWPMDYLKVLGFISAHGESFYPNQSVNGLLHRMLQEGANLEWEATSFAPASNLVYGATLGSTAVLVLAGLLLLRARSGIGNTVSLMFAGICFTMASPVAWEHHYGVLLPAFAFCLVTLLAGFRAGGRSQAGAWSVLGVAYLLAANSLAMTNWVASTPFNVLQSYLFFAAIGLLCLTAVLAGSQARRAPLPAAAFGPRPDWAGR